MQSTLYFLTQKMGFLRKKNCALYKNLLHGDTGSYHFNHLGTRCGVEILNLDYLYQRCTFINKKLSLESPLQN